MSTARSTPAASRCWRKARGERQNSTICSKFARFFFIAASAPGLNIWTGWKWMWQSVIICLGTHCRQHRPPGEHPYHLPPVFRRKRRGSERLGGARGQLADDRGSVLQFVARALADEGVSGARDQKRRRVHRRKRHLSVLDAAVFLHHHRHTRQWVVNGAANTQLLIDAVVARRRLRQEDAGQNLVLLQLHACRAVVAVEVRESHAARAVRADNLQLRAQAQERRRRVAGERGPALR